MVHVLCSFLKTHTLLFLFLVTSCIHLSHLFVSSRGNRRPEGNQPQIYREDREGTVLTAIRTETFLDLPQHNRSLPPTIILVETRLEPHKCERGTTATLFLHSSSFFYIIIIVIVQRVQYGQTNNTVHRKYCSA